MSVGRAGDQRAGWYGAHWIKWPVQSEAKQQHMASNTIQQQQQQPGCRTFQFVMLYQVFEAFNELFRWCAQLCYQIMFSSEWVGSLSSSKACVKSIFGKCPKERVENIVDPNHNWVRNDPVPVGAFVAVQGSEEPALLDVYIAFWIEFHKCSCNGTSVFWWTPAKESWRGWRRRTECGGSAGSDVLATFNWADTQRMNGRWFG